jgi:hypothetical protein
MKRNYKNYELSSSTSLEEQETIINRIRSEGNKLRIYTSDTRVMRQILKHFFSNVSVEHFGQDKKLVAIECIISIEQFLRYRLLPTFKSN